MPRNMNNRRVSFSPDVNDHRPPLFTKHHHGTTTTTGNKKRPRHVTTGVWSYQSSSSKNPNGFSPLGFLKRLGAKVARALRFVSKNRKSSRKVNSSSLPSSSSSSSSSTLVRSRSYAETLDSHRAEAIEDCIEFLHSSSSCLRRSNSVSTTSY